MTSGGLGTMGYGLPAAIGVQLAHPKSLVIDIAGDASILMNIQECSTAVQFDLPVKVFILNNQYMGMVRQWQQLLHGNRLSHSYTDSLPDFVKLAEAYGWTGMRCDKPGDLDGAIKRDDRHQGPVIFDCRVAALANCFPMIPSGKAHNEMLLGEDVSDEEVEQRDRQRGQGAGVTECSPMMHQARSSAARVCGRLSMKSAHCDKHVLSLTCAASAAASAACRGQRGVRTSSPAWDQVANIKDAAERLGKLHRARGRQGRLRVHRRLLPHAQPGRELRRGLRDLHRAGLPRDRDAGPGLFAPAARGAAEDRRATRRRRWQTRWVGVSSRPSRSTR